MRRVARHYRQPFDPSWPEWTSWKRSYVEHMIAPYRAKVIRSRGGREAHEVARVIAALERSR
jgi:hypothetical protein